MQGLNFELPRGSSEGLRGEINAKYGKSEQPMTQRRWCSVIRQHLRTVVPYLRNMPGSSLWLLPPEAHPLNNVLTSLIKRTASRFGSSDLFIPHVTLTSDLVSPSSYGSDPQKWLESLDLPVGDDVQVEFDKLDSEDVYFRKLYIKCQKTAGLKALAKVCRKQVADHEEEDKARKWAEETYIPHVSLL